MNIAFCVGNGPSRTKVDLNVLQSVGPIYGCNQLIRAFPLDNTVIVDRQLLINLLAEGYNQKTNIYTRKAWSNLVEADNLYFLPDPIKEPKEKWDEELHWGSGTHALNIAARSGADVVIMIGYDLYNAGLDPSCWIYQINKCLMHYKKTQFVQIQDAKWETPKEWTTDNFLRDDYSGLGQLLMDQQLT